MYAFSSKLKPWISATVLCIAVSSTSLTANAEQRTNAGLVIVMHSKSHAPTFTKQQIRHIFMGGRLSRKYKAINWPQGNPLRRRFNTKMIGLTESRIQSYWAQMRFTGGSAPPAEAETLDEVLSTLVKEEGSVAYLPEGTQIPSPLVVIYP